MEGTPARPLQHSFIASSTPVYEVASHDSGYTSFNSHKFQDSPFTEGNHTSILQASDDSLIEHRAKGGCPKPETIHETKYSSTRKRKCYLGRLHVDFLKELQPYKPVLDRLLSKLPDKDLAAVCCTSRTWRLVCESVPLASLRWSRYIQIRRDIFETNRENLPLKKFHIERLENSNPLADVNRGTALSSQVHRANPPPQISKPICQIFVQSCSEESTKSESEMPCPVCGHPSTMSLLNNNATCSSTSCGHHFCTKCMGMSHRLRDCNRSVFTPITTPETKKPIGSKASKRNLRRL